MKKDISSRADLYLIVKDFYEKLLNDPVMFHFFEEFTDKSHLENHLTTLVDFWENILFYSDTYSKNAMQPHLELNKTKPIESRHFKQWLKHFNNSIDANFEGEVAHTAKSRALSIATVMQIKVFENGKQ